MANPGPPPYAPTLSTPRIDRGPWPVLVVLSLGFFMILLDTTIVNVAIPSIITSLHASLDEVLWVLNAYILVYAVLLITAGRFGDMFGPKRMFLIGLAIFTAASVACGQATSSNELILFRVIQAVGGAVLTPQTLSMITSIFPPEKRGAAFGLWGGVAGLAAAAGPTLGGFLTTTFSWSAIFYVNLPIGIAVIILAWLIMPELKSHRQHHIDWSGVALSTAGLFAIVFALIEGQKYEWSRVTSALSFTIGHWELGVFSIPSFLLAGVIILVLFVIWESRADEPLLPLSLFRNRNFSVANSVSAIVAFGIFGLFLPLTIFLQSVLGLSAEQAGVVFLPQSLVSMVVAPFAGRLSDRINGKYILGLGLALFAIGQGLVIVVASLSATGLTFTLPLLIAGVGMGCTFAPLTTLAMRGIAPQRAGAASGFLNTVRQVGAALGSAVVGAVLQNRLANELHSQAAHYSQQLPAQARPGFISGFARAAKSGLQVGRGESGTSAGATHLPAAVAHQLAVLGHEVFQHAYLNAMKPSLAIPILVLALGAIVAQVMRNETPAAESGQQESPADTTRVAVAGE